MRSVEELFRCSKCKRIYEKWDWAIACYNECVEKEKKEQTKLFKEKEDKNEG